MRGYTRSTRFRVATKAERASRLGDEALRALRRFIALFRKYSDDQPRDDHGRWTYVGRRIDQTPQDVDQTGSLAPKINAALTGDLEIDSITEKLLDKLEQVTKKSARPRVQRTGAGYIPLLPKPYVLPEYLTSMSRQPGRAGFSPSTATPEACGRMSH